MKQAITQLSLRAKFKDVSTVEVTVIDHKTNVLYTILWSFKSRKIEGFKSKTSEITLDGEVLPQSCEEEVKSLEDGE